MRSYLIVTLILLLCLSLAACEETLVSPNPADTDPVMAEGASKRGKPGTNDLPTVVSFEVEILSSGATYPITDDQALLAALLLDERDLLRSNEARVQIGFFGCPDDTRVCNKLTLVLSGGGTSDRISVLGQPSVQGCLPNRNTNRTGGCVYDLDLENRRNAASWSQRVLPAFPLNVVDESEGEGTRTFTLYWQGQRRTIRDNPNGTKDKVWDLYPDLDLVGEPDYFVFSFGLSNDKLSGFSGAYADCNGDNSPSSCWAEFQGQAGRKANTVWDSFQFGTSGKGKKAKKTFSFELQTFSKEGASLFTWYTMMKTDPSGARSIIFGGVSSDVDPASHSVLLSSGEGCYAFRLLDGHVFYEIDKLDYVWDSINDTTEGAETVWVDTINNTFTVGGTTCPAS